MNNTGIPLNDGTVYLLPVPVYIERAVPLCEYINRQSELDNKLMATIDLYTTLKKLGYFESTIPPMFTLALLDIILSITTSIDKVTEILQRQYRPYMELLHLMPPSKR